MFSGLSENRGKRKEAMKDLFTALANELNRKRDLVLVTIIRNEGSAPRAQGRECDLIEWLIRWNDRWRRCGVSVHPSCQGTDRDHRRPKRFLFSQRKKTVRIWAWSAEEICRRYLRRSPDRMNGRRPFALMFWNGMKCSSLSGC